VILLSSLPLDFGKIKDINQEINTLCGFKKEKLVGNKITAIIPTFLKKQHEEICFSFMEDNSAL